MSQIKIESESVTKHLDFCGVAYQSCDNCTCKHSKIVLVDRR